MPGFVTFPFGRPCLWSWRLGVRRHYAGVRRHDAGRGRLHTRDRGRSIVFGGGGSGQPSKVYSAKMLQILKRQVGG